MILGDLQRNDKIIVHERNQRILEPFQIFFDHDLVARNAECDLESFSGLLQIHSDGDAFAGFQSVLLDHDRRSLRLDIRPCRSIRVKRFVSGCRDRVFFHDLFGEILA